MTQKPKGRTPGTFGEKGEERQAKLENSYEVLGGASISLLVGLFRMDPRTIRSKIGNVQPCGKRRGVPIWHIRDVAPYLVKPAGDIEEHIKRMRPNDLPPLLSKEYWNGQRARQRYLEDEGDLWRTDRVVETLAEVFKVVRMNLLLMPDSIERKISLTDIQREELKALVDETLTAMRDKINEKFGDDDRVRPGLGDDHQPAPEPEGDDTFDLPDDGDDDTFDLPDEDDHGL